MVSNPDNNFTHINMFALHAESRLAKRSLEGASKSNTPEEKVRKVESEMSRQQTTPQSEIHVDNQMPEPGRVGSPPFLPGQSADVPGK